MKRGIFFVILLLGSILFLGSQKEALAEGCATSTGRSFLKINEFSAYNSSDWVELFNPLDVCVDLFGLSLHDTGQTAMRNYQKGAEIAPHGWYATSTSSRLDSQADSIFLMFDLDIIDTVSYSTATSSISNAFCGTSGVNENYVCARKIDGVDTDSGDDWAFSLVATPGQANQIQNPESSDPPPDDEELPDETPTSTFNQFAWSQLQISEILVDPNSGEKEWVELYNSATTSIDLTGGILCDSKEGSCEIGSSTSTVEAGEYIVLTWDSSQLNNTGDKVIWKNPAGLVVDEIQYGEGYLPVASDGNSLARNDSGNWLVTTVPTPGMANVIVAPIVPVMNYGGGGSSATNNSVVEENKAKIVKITTSTVKMKEDPVKVVFGVDYPSQGSLNEKILFDASNSADPRGGLLQFLWNFGDGTGGVGEKIEHSFASSGVFSVLVSATSTAGTIGSKKLSVRIASGLSVQNVGVKISEVLVNPIGADKKEFVKLHNSSSSTVDLSGWKLIYKDKEYVFLEKTKIFATSSLVFYQAVTHFMLENTGGKIELLTPDDDLADVLNYGKSTEGQSFISVSSGQVLGEKITVKSSVPKTSTKSTSGTKYIYGGSMSVDSARLAIKGTSVKVRGTVAVLPGIFGVQYFYLTDGPVGIQIYQNKKLFPDFKVGDMVEVSGVTSVSGEIKRIIVKNKTDMRMVSSGISTSTLVVIEDLNEEMLGGLIKIAGEITEIKTNYMYVDDGTTEMMVYFKQGAKIDKKKFKEGELVEITGVLEKSKTGLQLWPRGQEDIQVVGESEDLLNQAKTENTSSNNMFQTYLMVTAGGATVLIIGSLIKARWMAKSQGLK